MISISGPLIAGKTPSHSVLLYIQRQMERIRNCEVAMENPRAHDVVDCLLVWQLLEMVVQQQGVGFTRLPLLFLGVDKVSI